MNFALQRRARLSLVALALMGPWAASNAAGATPEAPPPADAAVVIPALPSDRVVSDADREVAKTAYAEVQDLWRQGALSAAVEPAMDAFTAVPNASTALLLATLYEKLGRTREALDKALLALDLEPTAAEAGKLDALLASLCRGHRPPLGWVRLNAEPAGALFTSPGVGGQEAAFSLAGPRTIALSAGRHRLEISAPGHITQALTLDVHPGQGLVTAVHLAPQPTPATTPITSKQVSPTSGTPWAPWALIGLGAASLGAGVGLHLWASDAQDEANLYAGEVAGLDTDTRRARYDAAASDVEARERGAYLAYGIGAAALVGGLLWLDAEGGDEAPETTASAEPSWLLSASPLVGGVQFSLGASF